MTKIAKRNTGSTSFGSVFVDGCGTSVSISKLSVFNCFHFVLYSRSL